MIIEMGLHSNFCCTFNSYVFACAFPWFLPSTMLHLAVCPFAKLCPKREAVLGQYCIFIRRSSRHPARPIPKQLTFEQFENIILRFRILEKNLKISNFRKKNLKIQIFEEMKRWFQNVANFITVFRVFRSKMSENWRNLRMEVSPGIQLFELWYVRNQVIFFLGFWKIFESKFDFFMEMKF